MKSKSFYIICASWLIMTMMACQTVQHLAQVSEAKYEIGQQNADDSDAEIEKIIAPYKEALDQKMDVEINQLTTALIKMKPQSTMGNWMTDIMYDYSAAHFDKHISLAIQNYGGMRVQSIEPGPLTVREIYELMPFDNEIVIMEMTGEQLMPLIEKMLSGGGWPMSRQIEILANSDGEILDVKLEGKAIDPNQIYYIALPDYVANGGDRLEYLIELPRTNLDIKVRDAIIEQSRIRSSAGQKEEAYLDNRIIIKS